LERSSLYFSHFIITSVNEEARQAALKELDDNHVQDIAIRQNKVDDDIAAAESRGADVKEINQLRAAFAEQKNKN